MNRYFEITDKLVEKVTQMEFGKPPVKETYTEKWDIGDDYIPKFEDGLNFVKFKAAEDVVVNSIWKGFLGAANTGLNMVTAKLNSLFSNTPEETNQVNYGESFKTTLIHTGVRAIIPQDEILTIYNLTNGENGLILANGIQIVKPIDSSEIVLNVYNMFPNDVKITKGQIIAIGVFSKVQIETNGVNLSK